MGKRKELKDGDVEMGGTNRPHDDDSGSEDVRPAELRSCEVRKLLILTLGR